MDKLFLILLPLVISGLGFLTYRHPPIARKILNPLFYISIGSILFIQLFSFVQSSAYYKSIDATQINIENPNNKLLDLDSLKKTVKDYDSINIILNDREYQIEKAYDIYTSQTLIKDSIRNNLNILSRNSRDANITYLLYCFTAFLIIIILQVLSFLFDKIYNKEKVSDIKEANEKT